MADEDVRETRKKTPELGEGWTKLRRAMMVGWPFVLLMNYMNLTGG